MSTTLSLHAQGKAFAMLNLRSRVWMFVRGPAIWAVLMLSASVAALSAEPPTTSEQTLAATIAEVFKAEPTLPLPVRQNSTALKSYYLEQSGRLLWGDQSRMRALIAALRGSDRDGLEPTAYPIQEMEKIASVVHLADGLAQAEAELYFSAFFLRFARDLKVGRFLPTKIDPKLYWRKKTIDPVQALKMMAKQGDIAKFISGWQPQVREYARMKIVLAAYRQVEHAGGWPAVPHGELIKPGADHQSVPAIYARLQVTDKALRGKRDAESTTYDQALGDALKRFQKSHGLEPDGVIGKQTLFALNIPVADRIRQIIVTMERWRWMPEDLGPHYIRVNIAGYELRRVRKGRIEEVMPVVVGKPYHQTPVFSDKIKYLEFNPYWNVPYSIAVKEELPKLKADPAARAALGFEAVVDGKAVGLTAINWASMSASHFPVRLRQKPGGRNALGRVKFMFPNRFNVYLHDTPARSLFAKSQRAFSHGCIRVGRPIDLAEQLLRGVVGWDRRKIDQVLASKQRTVVNLSSPIPVHLTYATVWLDQKGQVNFRPDIYRRDAKLEKALAGRYASF